MNDVYRDLTSFCERSLSPSPILIYRTARADTPTKAGAGGKRSPVCDARQCYR